MTRPLLLVGMGSFWLVAYLLIISRGFRDRTFGMPVTALCANISWEFVFSFLEPFPPALRAINGLWFTLDLIILYQVLRWGPDDFPNLQKRFFYAVFGVGLVTSFLTVFFMTRELPYRASYSAFAINLTMSVLFVAMLVRRRSLRGQSIWIGIAKMLGSLCASLYFFLYFRSSRDSVLLPFLGVSSFFVDVVYVLLLVFWDRLSHVVVTRAD